MSKTHQQTSNNSSSLAAAFSSTPVLKTAAATLQHQEQQQSSKAFTQNNNNINNHFVRHNSSQSDCDHYYYQEQEQQQQQVQDHDCQSTCSSSLGSSQQGQQLQQGQPQLQGPTFISVFPNVKAILPHHNNSAKGQVPWSCSNCKNPKAFGHKCQQCHKSRDTAALRVFMGQLTKEGDVQLIHRMLEVVCPQLDQSTSLLHIEPHTHANTGRGKGCAWVYVRSLEDVLYLVERLHKRTYPTVNAETGEVGFVAFPDTFSTEDIKDAFDNDITFLGDHVVQLFHRSPITAEVPLSLQRALNLPSSGSNNNKAQQQQVQQQHQHNHVQQNNNNNNVNINMNRQQQQQQQSMQVVAYSAPKNNNLNNTMIVQQQQQENINNNKVHTTSPFKRYRWNPYSATSARVPVRC